MLMENLVAIEETSALYIPCLYFYLPSDRYKIPDEQNATLDSEGKKSRPITTTFNKTPGERENGNWKGCLLKTYQILPQGNISFSTALCLKYLWIAGICFLVILKMYFFSSWFGGEADGWQCAEVGGRRRLSSLYSQEDKRPETGEVREGEEETKGRGSTREGHP